RQLRGVTVDLVRKRPGARAPGFFVVPRLNYSPQRRGVAEERREALWARLVSPEPGFSLELTLGTLRELSRASVPGKEFVRVVRVQAWAPGALLCVPRRLRVSAVSSSGRGASGRPVALAPQTPLP